jgi:hypothetical protein
LLCSDSLFAKINNNSVKKLNFENFSIDECNEGNGFFELVLTDAIDEELLCSRTFVDDFESLTLSQGNFEYKAEKQGDFWKISINSNYFIKALQISTKHKGRFSDNWLDIIPGKTTIIFFYPKDKNIQNLELNFNSVNDILKREGEKLENLELQN